MMVTRWLHAPEKTNGWGVAVMAAGPAALVLVLGGVEGAAAAGPQQQHCDATRCLRMHKHPAGPKRPLACSWGRDPYVLYELMHFCLRIERPQWTKEGMGRAAAGARRRATASRVLAVAFAIRRPVPSVRTEPLSNVR